VLTALLTRAEVSRHLRALNLLHELRSAFLRREGEHGDHAVEFAVEGAATAAVRHGTLPGLRAWSVTVQPSTPATRVLQLYDRDSGALLALMDAGHLTALRASVVGALAADALARPDARNVALLGNGPAVSSALKALRLVRSLERITLFDPELAASTEQAMALKAMLSVNVRACETEAEAVATADIVVMTGDVPLTVDALSPGAHVTVMAPERALKPPLPQAVLARARCFSDDRHPRLAWAPPIAGDLGQVLSGALPARTEDHQLTVFFSLGPPTLDLVAAWHVYEGAQHDETLTRVDLRS
jgi:ornithine cyclodeaminase